MEGNEKQQESSTARDEKWNCRHQGDIKNLIKASINKKAEEISCKKSSKSLDVNKLFPKNFKNTLRVHLMHMPLWFNKGVWKYFWLLYFILAPGTHWCREKRTCFMRCQPDLTPCSLSSYSLDGHENTVKTQPHSEKPMLSPNYSLQLTCTLQTYYFMKLMVSGSEIVASFVAGDRQLMRTL